MNLIYAALSAGILVQGRSWTGKSSGIGRGLESDDAYQGKMEGDSDSELRLLQVASDALERFKLQPDCFNRVAQGVRFECAGLGQEGRVAAAISMTLCETKTATHYSIPMECRPFDPESEVRTEGENFRGACVDALSRSAQLWSSYSGYLRELPLLCVAFQKLNDIDVAREVYRNITAEKMDFIRFVRDQRLKDHDRELRRFTRQEDFVEDAREVVSQLRVMQKNLSNNALSSIIEKDEKYAQIFQSLVRDLGNSHSELFKQSTTALDDVVSGHSAEISRITRTLEEAAIRQSQLLAAQHEDQQKYMIAMMEYLERKSFEISRGMNNVLSSVVTLEAEVSKIMNETHKVGVGLQGIESDHRSLLVIEREMAFSIRALTSHVQSEMQSINETMFGMRRGYAQSGVSRDWRTWLHCFWIWMPWVSLIHAMVYKFGVSSWLAILLVKTFLIFPVTRLISSSLSRKGPRELKTVYNPTDDILDQSTHLSRGRRSILPKIYSMARENEAVSRIPSRLFT